jgi:hypothetical protein
MYFWFYNFIEVAYLKDYDDDKQEYKPREASRFLVLPNKKSLNNY